MPIGRPLEPGDVVLVAHQLPGPHRHFGVDGFHVERLVARVLVDHLVIVLLLLPLLQVLVLVGRRESDAAAIRRDLVGADHSFPVGEHLGLAAVHGNTVQVLLAGAVGEEEDKAAVGGELRRRRALLAAGKLDARGAIGVGQENVGEELALLGFHDGAPFHPQHQFAVGRRDDVVDSAHLHGKRRRPGDGRVGGQGRGGKKQKPADHSVYQIMHGLVPFRKSVTAPRRNRVGQALACSGL